MSLSLSSPGERKRGKIPRRHCCRHRSKPQNPTTTTTTEMRQPHKLSRPKQAQTLAKSLGQKGVKTGEGEGDAMRTGVVRNVPHVARNALTYFKGFSLPPKWEPGRCLKVARSLMTVYTSLN